MIYENIKGTSMNSFKIGARGLMIRSGEIIEGKGTLLDQGIAEFRRLSVTDPKNNQSHDLAYYDLDIPNYYIDKIETNDKEGITTIYIFDKENRGLKHTVTIRTKFDSNGVKTVFKNGIESTKIGSIVTYADEAGQEIQDSGCSITDTMVNLSDADAKQTVPTAKAVSDFIGVVSLPLEERLDRKVFRRNR